MEFVFPEKDTPGFEAFNEYLPNKKNMDKAMKWMVKDIVSGDSCAFFYSGHGYRTSNLDLAGEKLYGAVTLGKYKQGPRLTSFGNYGLPCAEIREKLTRQLPAGANLTMIFDCCCSASMGMLNHRLDGTGKSWVNGDFATKRQIKANVLCLAACNDKELAKSTVFLRKILSAEGYLDESGNGLSTGLATPKNLVQLRKEVTTKMAGQDMNMQIEVSHRFDPTKYCLDDFLNGARIRAWTPAGDHPLGLAIKGRGIYKQQRYFTIKKEHDSFYLAYYEEETKGSRIWKEPGSANRIQLSDKQITFTFNRKEKTLSFKVYKTQQKKSKIYYLSFEKKRDMDAWRSKFTTILQQENLLGAALITIRDDIA